MILQPGQRGSNGSHGKREPYVRKNILMRNTMKQIQDAIDRRGIQLRKAEFVKRDIACRSYGTLVAMSCAGLDKWREAWWAVTCLCGNVDIVRQKSLINGTKRSLVCCKNVRL
jgi:hypothetical protein